MPHIYEIAEKYPQQQFEVNMTLSSVITLWVSLTKCQTFTFITNSSNHSSHDYLLPSLAPYSACRYVYNSPPKKLGKHDT
jgi:hypothetical protein